MRTGRVVCLALVLIGEGCQREQLSDISPAFYPGVTVSAATSRLVATDAPCTVGRPVRVKIVARDGLGRPYPGTDFHPDFALSNASQVEVGSWAISAEGTFEAEVTAQVAGSLPPLVATVNGAPLPALALLAVGPSEPAALKLDGLPSQGRQRATFSSPPTARLVDADNRTIVEGVDADVQVEILLDDGGPGALFGVTTRRARAGIATFEGLGATAPGTIRIHAAARLADGRVLSTGPLAIPIEAGSPAQALLEPAAGRPGAAVLSDPEAIALGTGSAELIAFPHADSDEGHFAQGVGRGVVVDPVRGGLRLGAAGACDGLATNCFSFDPSWTPRWDRLVGYWPLEGTGDLANGAQVEGLVGPPLTAHNDNGAGMHYLAGQVGGGLQLDGVDDYLSMPKEVLVSPNMTLMGWLRLADGTDLARFFDFGVRRDHDRLRWLCLYMLDSRWKVETQYTSQDGIGSLGLNGWTHIAVTLDGQQVRVFINGSVAATVPASTGDAPFFFAESLLVGASNNPGDPTLHGDLDELAIWSEALTPSEVAQVYGRQRARLAGSYVSRPMDLRSPGQAIHRLSWTTPQPFWKPLPPLAADEAGAYPEAAPGLGDQLKFLWALDEQGPNLAAGYDFADLAGGGNHAILSNNHDRSTFLGHPAAFGRGVELNSSAFVTTQLDFPGPDLFSYQLWFQVGRSPKNGPLMGLSKGQGFGQGKYDRMTYINGHGGLTFGVCTGPLKFLESPQAVTDLGWHHLVASLGPGGQRLFVDGKQVAFDPTTTSGYPYVGFWKLGYVDNDMPLPWPDAPSAFTDGLFDEAAVWGRELTAPEVLSLYRRGANRLSHQLRACREADCSDDPPWSGPDGTPLSAYSELDNHGPQAPAAQLQGLVGQAIQYRAFLESDDVQRQCTYASLGPQPQPCSPELTSLALEPSHFTTQAPSVTTTQPTPYVALVGLAATPSATGCPLGLRLMLSGDGQRWWSWRPDGWFTAPPAVEVATPPAALTPEVLAQFAAAAGAGELRVRVFLPSDGTSPCGLGRIAVDVLQ